MKKPVGYDEVKPKAFGEREELPAGGYILKILKAEPYTAKSGYEMLLIYFDIAQGEYKDYYKRLHERIKENNPAATWKGVQYQGIEGKGMSYFKGLMKAIEESNLGYKWNWEEETLKGKLFGGVIGLEEWSNDGKSGFNPKIRYTTSIETIKKGVEPPKDKLLEKKDDSNDDIIPDFHLMAEDDEVPF